MVGGKESQRQPKMRGEDANGVGREDSEECGISEMDGWMVVLVSEMVRVNA